MLSPLQPQNNPGGMGPDEAQTQAQSPVRSPAQSAVKARPRGMLLIHPMVSILSILCLSIPGFFQGCTLNESAQPSAYFHLEGSPKLVTYSRVVIILSDTVGNRPDTLFQDSLRTLSALKRLPADGYQGGKAKITIHGYRNGLLVYAESRLYDGEKQRVLSLDIAKDLPAVLPGTPPNPSPLTPSNPTLPPNGPIPSNPSPSPAPTAQPRAPSVTAFPGDTVVSIMDSISLYAEAFDADGDLAAYAWHCNEEGKGMGAGTLNSKAVDSATLIGIRYKIGSGTKFKTPGRYLCLLRLYDKTGLHSEVSRKVQVEYDAPRADAGQDTAVAVNSKIFLHAKGEDGYGPIVSRAWKIGKLDFVEIMQQETSIIAPDAPGELICILRIMDDDGLMGYDTLRVSIESKPAMP